MNPKKNEDENSRGIGHGIICGTGGRCLWESNVPRVGKVAAYTHPNFDGVVLMLSFKSGGVSVFTENGVPAAWDQMRMFFELNHRSHTERE